MPSAISFSSLCEATARDLHLVLSGAALGVVSSDRPLLLRSFWTVRIHVF